MDRCGPITLMVYNRCVELATRYEEMKDLKTLFLVAARCSAAYRRAQVIKRRRDQMATLEDAGLAARSDSRRGRGARPREEAPPPRETAAQNTSALQASSIEAVEGPSPQTRVQDANHQSGERELHREGDANSRTAVAIN